jgi:hypothetical protein
VLCSLSCEKDNTFRLSVIYSTGKKVNKNLCLTIDRQKHELTLQPVLQGLRDLYLAEIVLDQKPALFSVETEGFSSLEWSVK